MSERRKAFARGDEVEFESGHSRTGCAQVMDGQACSVCEGVGLRVVWIDSSEGEYGGGSVCFDCLDATRKDRSTEIRFYKNGDQPFGDVLVSARPDGSVVLSAAFFEAVRATRGPTT